MTNLTFQLTIAVLGTLCFAVPALAQSPTTQPHDPSRTSQSSDQNRNEEIQRAHQQLRAATMRALRDGGSNWHQGSYDKPTLGSSDQKRAGFESSQANISLQESQLMIAACPSGLLAGAPTTSSSSSTQDGSRGGTGRDTDTGIGQASNRSGTDPDALAGMVIVCNSDKPSSGIGQQGRTQDGNAAGRSGAADASTARSSGTSSASSSSGTLEPGVYVVKRSGNQVTLTNREGMIVLRASIEEPSTTAIDTAGRDRSDTATGSQRGDTSGVVKSQQREWECVFGAITAEVMHEWSDHSSNH